MTRQYPGASKFLDRFGKWRWRARAKGKPAVMLHGTYGSREWVAEWSAWANGKVEIGSERTLPGSVSEALVSYYAGETFGDLSANTQKAYRAMLERFRAKNGGRLLSAMTADEITLMRNKLKPEPSNMLLRCLRSLVRHSMDARPRLLDKDPTLGMKKRKNTKARKDGIYTWTVDDVAKYETRHPFGSKARLALDLLLYTAQRKSDVVTFGRQHEREGGAVLKFRQKKTGEDLELPIVGPLRASIDATETGDMAYLVTGQGKPFSAAGFGNWFRDRCNEAGLPYCSSHGLRKATATRLADAGKTPHEIMAITGHRSLSEVERYTKGANKRRLARGSANVLAFAKQPLANRDSEFASAKQKRKPKQ